MLWRGEVVRAPNGTELYRLIHVSRDTTAVRVLGSVSPPSRDGVVALSYLLKTLRAARAFGLSPCVLAAHEIECWLERGILAVRWRAARFYSSCSIAHIRYALSPCTR